MERRDQAKALREKEAFNFALFQYNPAPCVIVDKEGLVVKSNLARRHSPGGLPALGKALFDPAAGKREAELQQILVDAIRSGDVRHFPEEPLRDRILAVTIAPFPQGAIVITQDITEQKLAQEQLIQADKMVALGTLVSGVAHEISNPNNVLLLSASALRKLADNLCAYLDQRRQEEGDFDVGTIPCKEAREDLVELVETVERAGARIRDTVGGLKEFARHEKAELTQRVDVNKIVQAGVQLLQPVIHQATQNFSATYAEALPRVTVNAQRVEQVVVNLVSNACQALTGPHQGVRVTTGLGKAGDKVIVGVEDEGAGITPENLKRITDPFFTTRHDTGGTGLGLSISRKIIEEYGGALRFESEPGVGTKAFIELPAANEE